MAKAKQAKKAAPKKAKPAAKAKKPAPKAKKPAAKAKAKAQAPNRQPAKAAPKAKAKAKAKPAPKAAKPAAKPAPKAAKPKPAATTPKRAAPPPSPTETKEPDAPRLAQGFRLFETSPGNWSLILNGPGYAWQKRARAEATARGLLDRVNFDSEAGMFCAYGQDREALATLASSLEPLLKSGGPAEDEDDDEDGADDAGADRGANGSGNGRSDGEEVDEGWS